MLGFRGLMEGDVNCGCLEKENELVEQELL